MKNYKVTYIQQTKSRCGAYNYKYTDTVQAMSVEDAKEKIKKNLKEESSFKRYRVIFLKISEMV